MTYHKTSRQAQTAMFVLPCAECGKMPEGPTVAYDFTMEIEGKVRLVTVLFHRECASLVAQRLICDAFPNRYDDGVHTTGTGLTRRPT
jgi:hypothetical protein